MVYEQEKHVHFPYDLFKSKLIAGIYFLFFP